MRAPKADGSIQGRTYQGSTVLIWGSKDVCLSIRHIKGAIWMKGSAYASTQKGNCTQCLNTKDGVRD